MTTIDNDTANNISVSVKKAFFKYRIATSFDSGLRHRAVAQCFTCTHADVDKLIDVSMAAA